jgi:FecR protein
MKPFTRPLVALSLAFALCVSHSAFALDTGDIVVASIKGEVHIAVRGTDTRLRAGAVLELPATVRTGRDGAVELRQGATSVSVGPESLLEFPALASPGGSIDRIVQPRGTAFYSVGKRGGRKLRIETPFLVGVVKGTQFSVVAQDHSTNISLFEGLLEVRSADDSDVIDLHAGEIAMRDRAATDISVMKMEAGATPPVPSAPASKAPAGASGTSGTPSPKPVRPTGNVVGSPAFAGNETGNKSAPASTVVPGVEAAIETPAVAGGMNVDLGGAAVVDTNDHSVEVDTGTGQGAGVAAGVDVNVGVGVEVPGVDLGLDDDDNDNSGPSDNSGPGSGGNDNSGPGNGGSGNDNSGPGNDMAAIVETPAVAVEVETGIPPASIDVGANVSVDNGVSVDVGADLGTVTDIDLGLAEEETDNSGPGNNGNSGSGSGSGNSGSGGSGGGGNDNSGPGNVVDELLDTVTRRSGKQ